MFKYIVKRILSSILVLLGVVTITFFISRVLPSNPEVKWAGQRATPEQLAAYNAEPIALEPWDPMGSLAKAL